MASRFSLVITAVIQVIFIFLFSPSVSFSSESALFERTFTRGKGAPVTETAAFVVPSPAESYKVIITNGTADGSSRCSSAVINLNGVVLAGPSDLSQKVGSLTRTVELGKTNTLSVTLNSAPGSFLKINVTGTDSILPKITISNPKDSDILGSPSITVTGALDDSSAVVTINGMAATNSGGTYQGAIPLAYGVNTITVTARDYYANEGTASVSVIMDNVSPVVSIEPVAEFTSLGTLEIKGRVDDLIPLIVTVQGKSISLPAGGGAYLFVVDLSAGVNNLVITVRDNAGNSSQASVFITLDTSPPALSVSTLSDGSWTNNELLNLSGTVTDNIGIKQVKVNGAAVTITPDGSFSYPVVLRDGVNTITVIATDLAGNETTDTRSINLDRSAPGLTIITPSDNAKTNQSPIEVKGTVDEESTVTAKVNGVDTTVVMTGNDFSLMAALIYGTNTIEMTAVDRAGNTSSAKRTVILDNRNPSLAIINLLQDLKTNQANMVLSGTTDDLTTVVVTITMDGNTYTPTVTNGQFELPVTFATEKIYQITVRAMDEAGNDTTVQRNVVYDITAPAAPVIDPLPVATNLMGITVTGVSEPNAKIRLMGGSETTCDFSGRFSIVLTLSPDILNSFSIIAIDGAGNEGDPASFSIIQDSVPPSVSGFELMTDPKVTLMIPVSILFSEEMDSGTMNSSNIRIDGPSGQVQGSLSISGRTVIFTPASEFPGNRNFTLTVGQGAKDKAGNALSPVFTASFDTIRGPSFVMGEVYDDTRGLPLEGADIKDIEDKQYHARTRPSGCDR